MENTLKLPTVGPLPPETASRLILGTISSLLASFRSRFADCPAFPPPVSTRSKVSFGTSKHRTTPGHDTAKPNQ